MINPIVYNKQYVMTSAMAANFFECPVVNLQVEKIDAQISSMSRVLYLWTRRGILRHAKMLNTDNAWEVYFMLERAYFKLVEGEQLALEAPKTLTLDGASVWTVRQAARIFNVSRAKIQAALQTRTFERGMMKLRARFAELPSLFEPPKQIPAEVKAFGQMLKDRAAAMIDGGILLKEFGTLLTAE